MAICLTYSNYRVQKWYRNIWWFFRGFETRWFPIFSRGVCGVLPWRLLFPLWLIGPVQCGHWHIFYRGAPCTLHLIFYRAGTWYFTLCVLDLLKKNLHLIFYTVWDLKTTLQCTWGLISPKFSFRKSPSEASTLAPLVMKDEFTSKRWPAEKV